MTSDDTDQLTERQAEVLSYICTYKATHPSPPSYAEIGDEFGISPQGADQHLKALESKGYIRRTPHQSRSIEVIRTPDSLD